MTPLLEEELVELEITQGDRDAAVEAARSLEIERWATGSGYFAALLVQAFARHRLTTIRDLRARVEDAELSLSVYDDGHSSEYWERHPEAMRKALPPVPEMK